MSGDVQEVPVGNEPGSVETHEYESALKFDASGQIVPTNVRLARVVYLPYGYEVRIIQVEEGAPELEGDHSTFDPVTKHIYINKTYSPAKKRWCVTHEMTHAVADWSLWVAQYIGVEVPDGLVPDPAEVDEV